MGTGRRGRPPDREPLCYGGICRVLGLAPGTRLGRAVQDIDNIEPLADIPLYVRWLAENLLAGDIQKKKLEDAWGRVIEDFLSIEEFTQPVGTVTRPTSVFARLFAGLPG